MDFGSFFNDRFGVHGFKLFLMLNYERIFVILHGVESVTQGICLTMLTGTSQVLHALPDTAQTSPVIERMAFSLILAICLLDSLSHSCQFWYTGEQDVANRNPL